MRKDFETIQRGYVPSWRRQPKLRELGVLRLLLGICSFASVALLLMPTSRGYEIPLSIEWANHEVTGYGRLLAMELTLSVLAIKLTIKKYGFDSFVCLAPMVALGYLATSSPFSENHFNVFVALAVSAVVWQWGLAIRFDDTKLKLTAGVGTLALVGSSVMLGAGERVLGITTIVAANIAFYEYMLDRDRSMELFA